MSEAVRRLLRTGCGGRLPREKFALAEAELAKLARGRRERPRHASSAWRRGSSAAPTSTLGRSISPPPEGARRGWDPRFWTIDEAARVLALARSSRRRRRLRRRPSCRFAARPRSARRSRSIAGCRSIRSRRLRMAGRRRVAHLHARDLRGDRASQSLSEGEFLRGPLEPHGAESAVHRLRRWRRSRGSTSAPTRRSRKYCPTTRMSAGPPGRPVTPELWRCLGPFADGDFCSTIWRGWRRASEGTSAAPPPWRFPRARTGAHRQFCERIPDEAASGRSRARCPGQALAT